MKYKRKIWKPGAVYGLPLTDGSFGVCQAIEAMWPTVIYIAVFSHRFEHLPAEVPPLNRDDVLSLGATWRPQLNNGSLPFLGSAAPVVSKRDFPNEAFSEIGYVGAQHSDIGLYSDFLDACFGLTPWNTMFEEDWWENYLNTKHPRPPAIRTLDAQAREKYRAEMLQKMAQG